jgi:hypothetical protein
MVCDQRVAAIQHVDAQIQDVSRDDWAPHFDRLYDAHASKISWALEDGDDLEEALLDLTLDVRTAVVVEQEEEKIKNWFP